MTASFKGNKKSETTTFIPEHNKFILTLIEATTAVTSTGKWDKSFPSESVFARANTPKAADIRELKITNLPTKILISGLRWPSPESTPLYTLIENILHKNSKVEVLDLSNHEFDEPSLLILEKAIQDLFPTKNQHLKKIILSLNQLAMKETLYTKFKCLKSPTFEIVFINTTPTLQNKK
jgi:hypothetical protein